MSASKKRTSQPRAPRPRIVAAAGTAVGNHNTGDYSRAKRIEQAMVAAIEECMAKGITDPNVIRQAQLDARDKAKSV